MSQDFGKASYVAGRHRKNPVLVYTSRSDRTKVYEFMIASKFKVPGLVSWKCVSCAKIKNGYRNLGAELKRKVPLILVDNDVIKEDPEKPLNAEHFCNGKEAVEAVVSRAKLEFVHRHGDDDLSSRQIRETIQDFAREAAATTPIPLSMKEKKHVQRTLDANCLPLLHGVKKRRRCKQRKDEEVEFVPADEPSTSDAQIPVEKPEESPTKKRRAVAPTAIVRPLPPYYYRIPQNAPEYYEDVVIDDHEYTHHIQYDHEELIPADQQDVAYDIELG